MQSRGETNLFICDHWFVKYVIKTVTPAVLLLKASDMKSLPWGKSFNKLLQTLTTACF